MNKLFGVLVVAGFISSAAYAENPLAQRPKPGVSGRLEQMKSSLNLSADQAKAVEAALEEEMAGRRSIMEEMRTKQMDLQKKFDEKISSLLKPEQLEKFKSMRGNVQARMKERIEKKSGTPPSAPAK